MLAAPLTAVNLALKPHPEVAALSHVGSIISSYLDGSMLIPLDKACLLGSTRLLDRIWQNSDPKAEKGTSWSLCRYLRVDVHYYRYQFTKSLRAAVEYGDLDIVKWVLEHFSGCTSDQEVVEEAARHGRMEILQYLFEYGHFEVQPGGERNVILWGGDDMANAIRGGHGEVAQWLYENTPGAPRNLDHVMAFAVRQGNMNLVHWLLDVVYEAEILLPPPSINDAAVGGHMEMLQWIAEQCFGGDSDSALEGAAKNGRLEMVQWLKKNKITTGARYAVEEACRRGHLNVVQWLLKHCEVSCPHFAAKLATENGHLHIVTYLCDADIGCKPERMMVDAAAYGHLHLIQWLLEKYGNKLFPSIGPAQSPMDRAASNGHFHVLQFLHALAVEMRTKGESGGPTCTNWALSSAASTGHLDIVKWLRKNYPTLCFLPSTTSMAAGNGHLEMLQWLHSKEDVEWSSKAMDLAAEYGHLSVVKWLHENHDEGCTNKAMNYAARNGHLTVVRWLQLNRSEDFTADAMAFVVEHEQFEVLLFLRAHGSEECSTAAKLFAREHKQPHILAWLEDQYPDTGM